MFRKSTLAYLAGILDGEGCVQIDTSIGKNTWRVVIANTDKSLIKWIHQKFGGHLRIIHREGNRKTQYWISFRKNEIKEFLPQTLPYLKIKKEDAKKILEYFN